jgi:hypothetical protein
MGTINWGNAPQWVSAGVTAAGFAWVIAMFQLEIRRRRVSFATPLIVFTDRQKSNILVRNTGKYPYFSIDICVANRAVGYEPYLAPGDEIAFSFDATTYEDQAVSAEYTDIRNQEWRRSVRELPKHLKKRSPRVIA